MQPERLYSPAVCHVKVCVLPRQTPPLRLSCAAAMMTVSGVAVCRRGCCQVSTRAEPPLCLFVCSAAASPCGDRSPPLGFVYRVRSGPLQTQGLRWEKPSRRKRLRSENNFRCVRKVSPRHLISGLRGPTGASRDNYIVTFITTMFLQFPVSS